METINHPHTYLVRKDGIRFRVAEIEDGKVDKYLHELKKLMPKSNWRIEPRFPVCGAD